MNPTTNQLIWALVVFGATLITVILTRRPSIQASIQRQRDEWARSGGAPDHYWIDTSASFGANALCTVWIFAGSYIMVAILSGNVLWIFVTLKEMGLMR